MLTWMTAATAAHALHAPISCTDARALQVHLPGRTSLGPAPLPVVGATIGVVLHLFLITHLTHLGMAVIMNVATACNNVTFYTNKAVQLARTVHRYCAALYTRPPTGLLKTTKWRPRRWQQQQQRAHITPPSSGLQRQQGDGWMVQSTACAALHQSSTPPLAGLAKPVGPAPATPAGLGAWRATATTHCAPCLHRKWSSMLLQQHPKLPITAYSAIHSHPCHLFPCRLLQHPRTSPASPPCPAIQWRQCRPLSAPARTATCRAGDQHAAAPTAGQAPTMGVQRTATPHPAA